MSATTPTAEETLHLTVDRDFEDVVDEVQLEHELAGFETVAATRMDEFVRGVLDEEPERTALLVVCHAEIARDALDIDQRLAGLLPCTTVVYEDADGGVHVHHVSATKAMRDLGCAPGDCTADVEALVELTGDRMTDVWENIEAHVAD
ncbi:MAG: DUF302 domain-containing protein [Halolamina sp.]